MRIYLASGFSFLRVSSVRVIAIPVAEGIIITSWLRLAYPSVLRADLSRAWASFRIKEDPAALG